MAGFSIAGVVGCKGVGPVVFVIASYGVAIKKTLRFFSWLF